MALTGGDSYRYRFSGKPVREQILGLLARGGWWAQADLVAELLAPSWELERVPAVLQELVSEGLIEVLPYNKHKFRRVAR